MSDIEIYEEEGEVRDIYFNNSFRRKGRRRFLISSRQRLIGYLKMVLRDRSF